MVRTACIFVLLVATAAAEASAQSRAREREFGLSQDDWCREARRVDHCEVREETLANVNVVDVDARGNGGVSVRGWDRPDVHVRARIAIRADSSADAKELAADLRLVTTGGRIRTEHARNERRNRDRSWWVSYEVQVPRDAQLTLDATNGGISVVDVSGRVDARTVNGGLALTEVSGNVRGETVNGGVHIELRSGKWNGAGLDVRTVNGGIRLAVPQDFSAELEARAVNGGIRVDFPITVSGLLNRRRQITGTIGSGGPPVRLSATNGGVSITRR